MVVVYLKNGEKAPLPDATHVRLDSEAGSASLLHCMFNGQEVGVFKWDEVAGYSIAPLPADVSPAQAWEAWGRIER